MSGSPDDVVASAVTVRYWAAARAAAGVDSDAVPVEGDVTLSRVLAEVRARHEGNRFRDVVAICSVMVGERPVGGHDPDTVVVRPGETVELLPPFAGG